VQPIGPSTYVTVSWEGGALTARVPGIAHVRPGESVRIALDPESLHFFDAGEGHRFDVDA